MDFVAAAFIFFASLAAAYPVQSVRHFCHCLPEEPCFPTASAWNEFSQRLEGRLLQLRPVAAPCHDPTYDDFECNVIKANWKDAFWRSDQPSATQHQLWEAYHNYTCFIGSLRNSTCFQGSVPVYAVEVSKPSDVSKAFAFAKKHNIRVTVKNTGHDAIGRETGRGSLSIWTHHLKNITFHNAFVPHNCPKKVMVVPAVTIGAGVQWDEIYSAADAHNQTVVGAYSRTVGASGGFVLGGGHSILAPSYGFAADNVLQLEVVTPDGMYQVANRYQNKTLFWSLLGGGGGTFGVVLSTTYRTHPRTPVVNMVMVISVNNTADLVPFVKQLALAQPALADKKWGGTFRSYAPTLLRLDYILPNGTESDAKRDWEGLLTYAQSQPTLQVNQTITMFQSFYAFFNESMCQHFPDTCKDHGGSNEILGTRLVSRSVLEDETSAGKIAEAIVGVIGRNSNLTRNGILGMSVGGGRTLKSSSINAVNPAWRKSIWHVIASAVWSDGASADEMQAKFNAITETTATFRAAAPDTGAYVNEADVNEPNWQASFFGSNYKRLLQMKRIVDPEHQLACHHCVGSEVWNDDFTCRTE